MFVSHAQNFEDVMLHRALEHVDKGVYIDIGAQDTVVDSVSLAFYNLGWRGLHVEPTSQYAAKLRSARPDEDVVEAAVAAEGGLLEMHEIKDTGLSTGKADIAERHLAAGFAVERRLVPSIRLEQLLNHFEGSEIHWLKIDVEGMEKDVIAGWGESPARPWIVVVESTLPNSPEPSFLDWESDLLALGYRFAYFDGLNRFYVSALHGELMAAFQAPPNFFDDFALSPDSMSSFGRLLKIDLEKARADLEEVRTGLASATKQLGVANERRSVAETDLDGARAELAAVREQLAAANEQTSIADRDLDGARAELASVSEQLAAANEQRSVAKRRLDATRVELAAVREQLAVANERHASALAASTKMEEAFGSARARPFHNFRMYVRWKAALFWLRLSPLLSSSRVDRLIHRAWKYAPPGTFDEASALARRHGRAPAASSQDAASQTVGAPSRERNRTPRGGAKNDVAHAPIVDGGEKAGGRHAGEPQNTPKRLELSRVDFNRRSMLQGVQRYWFDISTISRWQGAAVGITRVERELAARGVALCRGQLSFCVYDPNDGVFRHVQTGIANSIISKECGVDYSSVKLSSAGKKPTKGLRYRLRHPLRQFPRLYYVSQRIRRKKMGMSYNDITNTISYRPEKSQSRASGQSIIAVGDCQTISLDDRDVIISCGLDWEHKDIRRIFHLKNTFGFRYIAVLYDLIPLLYPHYVVPEYADLLRDYFGELFWVADKLMCISECTRSDMIRHCLEYAIKPPISEVFPLGSNLLTRSGNSGSNGDILSSLSGKKFSLFVSTIEPRKNHRVLYDAWVCAMSAGRLHADIHRLVFVGRTGWSIGDLLQEIRANPLTRDTILILDNVTDEVLAELYERCVVTLFPSHYEGYGLPVAEALARGKPCVASSAGALSEIGGELVKRVDPHDVFGWANAIVSSFGDSAAVADWGARIKSEYIPVTWDDAAAVFFDVIDRDSVK